MKHKNSVRQGVGRAVLIKRIVLVIVVIFVYMGYRYIKDNEGIFTPTCQELPIDTPQTPTPVTSDNSELMFLKEADKQKIYDAIESAKDAKDFDTKFYFAMSEALDSASGDSSSGFLLAPEIMSDNPGKIEITSGGCKTDLLAGIDMSPVKSEDMPMLKSYAKIFVEELSLYPLAWWKHAVPPFIVFVKAIKVDGEIVSGVEHGAVIYNIASISNEAHARKTVHHELMHWLEYSSRTRTDSLWPGQKSTYTNSYDLSSEANFYFHPEPGFVTGYAKTNSLEDKAEIYKYLFTPNDYLDLKRWENEDPILKKKVEYIKNFIKSRVTRMDEKFFQQLFK